MPLVRESDYTTMPGAGISGTGIFQVTIFPGIPAVGANVLPTTWLGAFRKVSGLSRDMEVQAVAEGGYNHAVRTLFKPPSKHGEITLESGSVGMPELWAWARTVDAGNMVPFRTIVMIEHFKGPADPQPIRTYTLLNAWPVKWKSSDLDAQGNALAVDSLTLAYDDLLVDNNPIELLRGVSLVKGTLSTASGESPKLSVELQFNPKNVKMSRSLSWSNHTKTEDGATTTTAKDEYPVLKPPDYAPDTLTLDSLVFDASEDFTNATLLTTLQALHQMTLHRTTATTRPPLVEFVWGDLKFVGGISSLTMNHTLFDTYGGIRRAEVSLTLTGQLIGAVKTSKIDVNTG